MKIFLKIITYVFQPLLVSTYGIVLLMQLPLFQLLGVSYRTVAIIGTIMFTAVFPALPILLMIRRGHIHDVFISRREERTMPYLFSLLAYVFWVLFLWRTLHFPIEFIVIAIGSVLSLVFMVITNLKWKISAHTAGMGGLVGCVLAVSYIMGINPMWLIVLSLIISGLVAVSRIYLKAHTLSQTIAGFCLGVSCVLLSSAVYTFVIQ